MELQGVEAVSHFTPWPSIYQRREWACRITSPTRPPGVLNHLTRKEKPMNPIMGPSTLHVVTAIDYAGENVCINRHREIVPRSEGAAYGVKAVIAQVCADAQGCKIIGIRPESVQHRTIQRGSGIPW